MTPPSGRTRCPNKRSKFQLLQGSGGPRSVDGGRDRLLTVRQIADRLGVCAAMMYALVERGELLHVRVSNAIRVTLADLAAFIAAMTKAGSTLPRQQ